MNNKRKIIYAIAFVAVGIFIWQLALFNQSSPKTSDNNTSDISNEELAMHEEYAGLPEDNRFVKESANQTIERFKTSTGVIMLGFKECAWCQKAAPLLNEAAETEDVSVYYLDISKERENNPSSYQEIVALLSQYLQKDESGLPRITTPDISIVKNGEIIWRYELEATTENERTPETYWTEAREERAIQDFQKQMKSM